MSTTLLRSLIAGSISAATALLITAAPVAAAAEGDDLPPFEMAPLCHSLDPANLDVRGARDRSENWQWSFWVNGNTSKLCNDTIVTELINLNTGASTTQEFTLFAIIAANGRGEEFVSTFATQCDYRSSVYLTAAHVLFADSGDVHRPAFTCAPPDMQVPEDVIVPEVPFAPTTTPTTTTPAGPTTTVATTPATDVPPTSDAPDSSNVPGTSAATDTSDTTAPAGELPDDDNSAGWLVAGGLLVFVGAALAITAIVMKRRQLAG